MLRRLGPVGAVALALVLFLWPFTVTLGSPETIYNALAADTYYYAALARNFAEAGFFSMDGRSISSGYMPLWQIIVAALDGVFVGPDTPPQALLQLIFWVSVALVAFGVAGLVWFVSRRFGPGLALLSLPLICPGAGWFLMDHVYRSGPRVGLHSGLDMWSFANGMESGIGLALFAVFVPLAWRALVAPTRGLVFWVGTVAFLIFMARLDDVFLGLAFGLCLLPLALRTGDARLLVSAALVPLIGTALYLGVNTALTGSGLPSSGMLKTQLFSFPSRWTELTAIARVDHIDSRLYPLVAFFVIGVLGLVSSGRKADRTEVTPLVVMLSLYLVLKAGFLLSSVAVHEQGYWYYTNLQAALSLLVVIAVSRVLHLTPRGFSIAVPVAVAVAFVAGANARAQMERFPAESYATVTRDLCADPGPVLALLPDDARIIDTGDGFYAFCLDRPAVTLTGLSDSRAFNAERNAKGFYGAALDAGHDILVASPVAFASYDWRGVLGEAHVAVPLGRHKQITVWRIEPSE